jgi:hypothetical protein
MPIILLIYEISLYVPDSVWRAAVRGGILAQPHYQILVRCCQAFGEEFDKSRTVLQL